MLSIEDYFKFFYKAEGYNIHNTLLYSFLYIIAFLSLYLFIKNGKIVLDKYFNLNLVIAFSIIVLIRVAMDFGWVQSLYFFYTPYMQLLVLSLFSINIVVFEKRKDFFYFYSCLLLIVVLLYIRKLPNFYIFPTLFLVAAPIYIFYKEKKELYPLLPIFSQLLDGIYGNIGIMIFKYSPKHVVHTAILNFFGLELGIFIFLLLKFSFLLLAIFIVKKYVKDKELKEIFYLMLFYVGYNAGLRNSLLVSFHEI